MQRYFIQDIDLEKNVALVLGQDAHHIKNVMRYKLKDTIILCSENRCFLSYITDISNDVITCSLDQELKQNKTGITVDIAQAIIRRERFEYMLQKSTELGVHNIFPTIMKNNVVKIEPKKETSKVERWNIITKEASEQAHRFQLAQVKNITPIRELKYDEYDVVLVCYEKENQKDTLRSIMEYKYEKILIVIGPEGGFDQKEIQFLQKVDNTVFVGLGPRILRSETASSYILSIISFVYEMGD